LRLVVFCSMEMAGDRPVDLVDIRLLHHLQELPRIGRQAFDIAALALGIDRVEGERRLARAGQAGHHDQFAAGNVHVDVLEIMFLGAANADEGGLGHVENFRAVCSLRLQNGIWIGASAYVCRESSLTTRTKCEQLLAAAKMCQQSSLVDRLAVAASWQATEWACRGTRVESNTKRIRSERSFNHGRISEQSHPRRECWSGS
jgi:hypothetical protein